MARESHQLGWLRLSLSGAVRRGGLGEALREFCFLKGIPVGMLEEEAP
jgi:hypothetical protein